MNRYTYIILALVLFTLYKCQSYKQVATATSSVTNLIDFTTSPVVPASESIGKMKLEDGFEVKKLCSRYL